MTLPQYRELAAYWQKFPPPHLFFAKLMQGSGKQPNDLSDLVNIFGRGMKVANP